MLDVLLVCMPFGPVFSPSIGLSLLRAGLRRHEISSRVRYFTIKFAEKIGQAFYWDIASDGGPPVEHLAGEWIFSAALFDAPHTHGESYLQEILLNSSGALGNGLPCSPAFIRRMRQARRHVSAFLDECLRDVLREQPKVVGFTSVFQQHVASLALARAIKRARPDITIVFGGANCEGVMGAETIRQFPVVDAVVSGEGDVIFPELVRRVLSSESLAGLQGVHTRDTIERDFATGQFRNAPAPGRLDDLPYPDFEDFFHQFRASRYDREWQPSVPFETARGCWWGERMHCTFCGLNGASMAFRSKSAERALEELTAVAERHPGCDVDVVDNILDMRYFTGFLPALAIRGLDVTLFYETKSNLKKHHVRTLRDAGVRRIQPGIESFSDPVLKLMRKGVTGLQNIQLLKWCKELGVTAEWNLLWGFPAEPPEEYARMAEVVPLLTHLSPPAAATSIRLDRFSPNYFDAEKLGLVNVRPMPSYQHVYPFAADVVANLAYYFTFQYRAQQCVDTYVNSLATALDVWQKVARRSDLFAVDVDNRLVIWDLRPAFDAPLTVLDGADRLLYLTCDGICDLQHLVAVVGNDTDRPPDVKEICARLEALVSRGLMLKHGSRYLALAVLLGEYSPPPEVIGDVYRIARLIGHRRSDAFVIPLDRMDRSSWRLALHRRAARARTRKPGQQAKSLTPAQFSFTDLGELTVR